jgi:anthranilate/para-aminobenzoate synthase component I
MFMHVFTHGWRSPCDVLPQLAQQYPDLALLYSGMRTSYSGDRSWLGLEAIETVEGNSLQSIESLTHTPAYLLHDGSHVPQWFGYLTYEIGYECVGLMMEHPSAVPYINTPLLRFTRFHRVFLFDHTLQSLTEYTNLSSAFEWPDHTHTPEMQMHTVSHVSSNMSKQSYQHHITATKDAIMRGDFYQANITRKFYTTYEHTPSAQYMAHMFKALTTLSPAPYSAFMQWQHLSMPIRILSSSPELFFHHFPHKQPQLTSRPIKGTMPKEITPDTLAKSTKNQAENLMIVDLMRNDFSKIAQQGSVHVPVLFDVDSFSTLHHLSSTITANTHHTTSLKDILMACFPAGSMTGAPKLCVMEWCRQIEQTPRGIYSGAIGWISGNHCEFSVVIRTLLQQEHRLEFQVGGGIVYDSTPEDEWQETLIKARALCSALNISYETIASI